jgi:uncharacterized GH25 family protein
MRRTLDIAILLALLVVLPAQAEDSWLIVDADSITEGDPLWLAFVTGRVFPIGDAPTDPATIDRFVDLSNGQAFPVLGYARQDLALSLRRPLAGSGLHVIGCALEPQTIDLPPDEFDEYLRRERAEAALLLRAQGGDGENAVCETYTKYAKTIVEVDSMTAGDEAFATPLGHRLEIIPKSNPCQWRAGMTVSLQVLLDGYPWPGIAVSAGHEGFDYPARVVETQTDDQGVAAVMLDSPGHWFVKAHLIRPTNGLGRPRWESYWATLTFRAAGPLDVTELVRSLRLARRELDPWLSRSYDRTRLVLQDLINDVFVKPPAGRLAAAAGRPGRAAPDPR